jgi:hypothetical protein
MWYKRDELVRGYRVIIRNERGGTLGVSNIIIERKLLVKV